MKSNNQKRSVNFPVEILAELDKLAIKNHTTTSALIRQYVEKGLGIDSNLQDIDIIAQIVRQEIRTQLAAQVERLVKILMKIGKVSASVFYTQTALLSKMPNTVRARTLVELETEAIKRGIQYMKLRDVDVDSSLQDTEAIFQKSELL